MTDVEWCNWAFNECIQPSNKWLIKRDCQPDLIPLNRGDSKNWVAYKASLEPTHQFYPPPFNSKCPNCGRYINGVNPSDDGETWRK